MVAKIVFYRILLGKGLVKDTDMMNWQGCTDPAQHNSPTK